MKRRHRLNMVLILAAAALTSCSTVQMPNLDFLDGNAFSEDFKNIDTSIPDVDEAPATPTDVRSTKEWDESAEEMIVVRDAFVTPGGDKEALTAEEIDAEFQAKKNKVQAYKLDDPVE